MEEFEEEVKSEEAGTQHGGRVRALPGVRAAKSSEFRGE